MANTVRITGVTAAIARISKIDGVARKEIIWLAERIHELAVVGAQKHTSSKTTGALVLSLGSGPDKIPGGWEVGHSRQVAPHAIFVHWGTRAHDDIRPKTKKALRWVSGSEFVFAKVVRHHPGYKGDAYLVPAVNTALANFRARALKV